MESPSDKTFRKRKRTVLSVKQKVELCQRFNAGVDKQILMDDYNIGSSTVYDIKSREDEWLRILNESVHSGRASSLSCRYKIRRTKMDELENILFEWFQLKREEGCSVTGSMMISRAKELSQQLGLKDNESCAFSQGWLSRFKGRYNIDKLSARDVPKMSGDLVHGSSSEDSYVNNKTYFGDDDDSPMKQEVKFHQQIVKNFDVVGWEEASSAFSNVLFFVKSHSLFSNNDLEQLERLHKVFFDKLEQYESHS